MNPRHWILLSLVLLIALSSLLARVLDTEAPGIAGADHRESGATLEVPSAPVAPVERLPKATSEPAPSSPEPLPDGTATTPAVTIHIPSDMGAWEEKLPDATPPVSAHGRVVNVEGTGIPGVEVSIEGFDFELRTLSREEGRFEFEPHPYRMYAAVRATDPTLVEVRPGRFDPWMPDEEVVLVLSPPGDLSVEVEVVYPDGAPVTEGKVVLAYSGLADPTSATAGRGAHESATDIRELDPGGRATFEAVPRVPRIDATAIADGYYRRAPSPWVPGELLRIVVPRPPQPRTTWIRGLVRTPSGEPAPGTRLHTGVRGWATSDDRGRFEIELDDTPEGTALVLSAAHGSLGTAQVEFAAPAPERLDTSAPESGDDPASGSSDETAFGDPRSTSPSEEPRNWIEVVLDPTWTLRGHVLGFDDSPVADARVGLDDPTVTSDWVHPNETLEGGIRASPIAPTDAEGAFELSGLSQRAYRLRVFVPSTLAVHVTGAIEPGSRPVIRLPKAAEPNSLVGRIVDPWGAPVPGARVAAYSPLESSTSHRPDARRGAIVSDPLGQFRIEEVSRLGTEAWIEAPGLIARSVRLAEMEGTDTRLEAFVDSRIEPPEFGRIELEFLAVDAGGSPTQMKYLHRGEWTPTLRIHLGDWDPETPVRISTGAAFAEFVEAGSGSTRVQLNPPDSRETEGPHWRIRHP